jgi:hypothetical protein
MDEQLLNCFFCGKRFLGYPEIALFGYDDDTPIYICPECDDTRDDDGSVRTVPEMSHIE